MEPVRAASPTLLPPLYGRTREVEAVTQMLRSGTRMVTLRGPGGIGKTALAQHIAQAVQQTGIHVVFVELAAVREAHQVLDTIVEALPAADRQGTALGTIARTVSDQQTLLILDNFEQVLDAAGDLLKMLTAADTVQMLVTSRTVLGLHDEHEYPLEPLSLPESLAGLEDSAAVEMFAHRVQAVQPDFQITRENAYEVATLVNALEGVPLAIELAAARLRSYTLTDLLEHLEHPLAFLKADFRDRPERLRSLRATVQWSYDLLDDLDRAVFECCAVFEGAFSPQALAAVWGSSEVIDRAEALLAQSFLRRLDTPDTLWRMLQPLRELALEHLKGYPQEAVPSAVNPPYRLPGPARTRFRMTWTYDPSAVRAFYDGYADREWRRLDDLPSDVVSFEVHRRLLRQFIDPGQRVLEVGAGPGRFTIELTQLGARVTVVDLSTVQLDLNARYVGAAGYDGAVEARLHLDAVDLSPLRNASFDVVVAYGGLLSYLRDRASDALAEMTGCYDRAARCW